MHLPLATVQAIVYGYPLRTFAPASPENRPADGVRLAFLYFASFVAGLRNAPTPVRLELPYDPRFLNDTNAVFESQP